MHCIEPRGQAFLKTLWAIQPDIWDKYSCFDSAVKSGREFKKSLVVII